MDDSKEIEMIHLQNDIRFLEDLVKKQEQENKKLKERVQIGQNAFLSLNNRIDKTIEKLYCYGEVFDRDILKQFQKEMLNILKGRN